MSIIAISLAAAVIGSAAFSRMPLNQKDEMHEISQIAIDSINNADAQDIVTSGNNTYIYTAAGLSTFRNNVNNGNTYAGQKVYLMADIDLSTVCSSTVGSWTPIGATRKIFCRHI